MSPLPPYDALESRSPAGREAALMAALLEALHPQTQLAVACGLTLPAGWCITRSVATWRSAPPSFADKHLPAVFLWLAA